TRSSKGVPQIGQPLGLPGGPYSRLHSRLKNSPQNTAVGRTLTSMIRHSPPLKFFLSDISVNENLTRSIPVRDSCQGGAVMARIWIGIAIGAIAVVPSSAQAAVTLNFEGIATHPTF